MSLPRWMTASGVRDWVIQRVTAVVLVAYLVILACALCEATVSYTAWSELFARPYFAYMTLAAIASLLLHAWVGLWTVITDYAPACIRKAASLSLLGVLIGLFVWSYYIFI